MFKLYIVALLKFTCKSTLPFVNGLSQSILSKLDTDTGIQNIRKYHIRHMLGTDNSSSFVPRGTITIVKKEGGDFGILLNQYDAIIGKKARQFDQLVATNQLYQLKFIEDITNRETIISVSACELRRSNFREEIILIVDLSGSIISASYTPKVSPKSSSCHTLPSLATLETNERSLSFQTKVKISTGNTGMTIPMTIPPLAPPSGLFWIASNKNLKDIHKTSEDFIPKEFRDHTSQHQLFFRKCWYILIPLLLVICCGGGEIESKKYPKRERENNRKNNISNSNQRLSGPGLIHANSKKQVNNKAQQRRGKRD